MAKQVKVVKRSRANVKKHSTVAQHYQAVLQTNAFHLEMAKDQWLSLKLYSNDHRRIASLSQAEFWEEIFTQVRPDELELSHVLMVVEICLVMAVSSSCCERGFPFHGETQIRVSKLP